MVFSRIIFVSFFVSIFLGAVGAWFISKYGHHFALLDKPNNRSSHQIATPKGGAIGILIAFVIVSIYLQIPKIFWLPAVFLAGISFIGDRIEISPKFRLLFQFAASIIFLFGYWKNPSSPAFNFLMIIPLAIFIVATANYYNFMDGINGIAAITGVIGFGLLAVFAHSRDFDTNLKILSITISLSCLGFLPFNMPHARVFMGDVGSILLGFVFAAMVIWFSNSYSDFICLGSFLFPFYADELTTELVRLKDGEKLWLPHRRHLYQLLANELSFQHWKVAIGYGAVQLFVGITMMYFVNIGRIAVTSIIFLYFLIFSMVSLAVRKKVSTKLDNG